MISHTSAITLSLIFSYAIVALSVGIVTGMGGELTLGQFALAGVGAVISYHVSARIGWFPLAFIYAGMAAALAAVLIGLPALRIRGLMFAVTTLAFALAAPLGIFGRSWALGEGVDPGRPIVLGQPLDSGREYYFVALSVLVIALILIRNARSSSFARIMVGVRDNEACARSFSISAMKVKIQGFMFAGFIAGLGGAVYGHALSQISEVTFPASISIEIAKIAVIGGISMMAGPLIGALFVVGLPSFLPLGGAALVATSLGQLLIIMYLPKGLAQIVEPVRNGVARYVGRRSGIDVGGAFAERNEGAIGEPALAVRRRRLFYGEIRHARNHTDEGGALLQVRGLGKSFGGITAVKNVSFDVISGETLGVIGPNGAGKTTMFEIVSGFAFPDAGTVLFRGRDVTWSSAESRARMGLIRSFQDGALFPTLTVEECVLLACERVCPTGFFSSVFAVGRSDSKIRMRAREVVDYMGLDRYRSKRILELSTGTRRIAELACLVALEPTMLLLDEPSSGVAQRETEALAVLLEGLKVGLHMTIVIIEHDIPLVMGLSDRVIAMADGGVLSIGSPSEVSNDRLVLNAYLGGDATAILRSDVAASM